MVARAKVRDTSPDPDQKDEDKIEDRAETEDPDEAEETEPNPGLDHDSGENLDQAEYRALAQAPDQASGQEQIYTLTPSPDEGYQTPARVETPEETESENVMPAQDIEPVAGLRCRVTQLQTRDRSQSRDRDEALPENQIEVQGAAVADEEFFEFPDVPNTGRSRMERINLWALSFVGDIISHAVNAVLVKCKLKQLPVPVRSILRNNDSPIFRPFPPSTTPKRTRFNTDRSERDLEDRPGPSNRKPFSEPRPRTLPIDDYLRADAGSSPPPPPAPSPPDEDLAAVAVPPGPADQIDPSQLEPIPRGHYFAPMDLAEMDNVYGLRAPRTDPVIIYVGMRYGRLGWLCLGVTCVIAIVIVIVWTIMWFMSARTHSEFRRGAYRD